MEVKIIKHTLKFIRPARTSRNTLYQKPVYYIVLRQNSAEKFVGIGECSTIPGLSVDDVPEYEQRLKDLVPKVLDGDRIAKKSLEDFPSIAFGMETALLDHENSGSRVIFPSEFTKGVKGIPINGLIWMGDKKNMVEQIENKLNEGYTCLKMKIGTIHFDDEIDILQAIRKQFSEKDLELRVDANGAFHPNEALKKINKLHEFKIHSIEQPLMQGYIDETARLCQISPIPIALDEELIAIKGLENKEQLLKIIKPAYIILKPSLLGGFSATNEWIGIAKKLKIRWWITSALESNIGLNAIAQFASSLNVSIPQGLGTGSLYSNNIQSPLQVRNNKLWYNKNIIWNFSVLKNN